MVKNLKLAHNGFILIELLIQLSIYGILIGASLLFSYSAIRYLNTSNDQLSLYSQLQLARFQAQALDTDVLIEKVDSKISSKTNSRLLESYSPQSEISISNKGSIGFTGNGTTKKSGKILIDSDQHHKAIILGVWDAPIKL